MNESVLQALMRLFAIVASVTEEGLARNDRDVVVEFLQRQFSREFVDRYLEYFESFLQEYHPTLTNSVESGQQDAENSQTVIDLCVKLNLELEQPQKTLVLVYLLDFINRGDQPAEKELKFILRVGENLNIPLQEVEDIISFSFDQLEAVKVKTNLLFIDSNEPPRNKEIKHLYVEKIDGRITVLHIISTNTYVMHYSGTQSLLLNGHQIKTNRSYIWALGSVLKNPRFGSIYYIWVAGRFIQATSKSNFVFTAKDIGYSYGGSQNGIKPFNLNEESGRLIGIIGGSGSGKSTLLKVLSGVIKPKQGSIEINGYDIHSHSNELKGIIGYVPQDDFLIKELTVFQNLYYNARLSFCKYSEEELYKVVDDALLNFDLVEARDLRVGDAFNTYLSGGQRKRLNIALELIREPSVLFVDEPTSGLSSMDSEKVMNLLKRQTFKGKLVFANIHQPSSEIFKLLDKLLVVDQGGRIIYYGNPVDAIGYFKKINHFVDADEAECLTCGNINADQILRNIEARQVNVNGRLTRKRKISPQEWYELYMERIDPIIKRVKRSHSTSVPKTYYTIPPRWKQVGVYLQRDLLAKLKNKQYLVITLLEAPVLAIILAFYTRSSHDISGLLTNYSFGLNANIPAYLFMSIIVALFLGMVISAEEIFRDRKILERERFLSLSRFSYLGSKITILFVISAIQMLLLVLLGNYILEIKSMGWRYFLILFSTSCWANIVGLNISSGFKSVVTIYILIPLILVPQLLFSGVVVDFHNLNKTISSDKYVPLVGECMTSRWSYEALMVTQFKDNNFEANLFSIEQMMNEAMYNKAYAIPELKETLNEIDNKIENRKDYTLVQNKLSLIKKELVKLTSTLEVPLPKIYNDLTIEKYNDSTSTEISSFLNNYYSKFHSQYLSGLKYKDLIYEDLAKKYSSPLPDLKQQYVNESVEAIVRNKKDLVEYVISGNEIIRMQDAIYSLPRSNFGRAHFYAPYKKIGSSYMDTFWFNILVIWLFTILLSTILYYDLLRKLINYFNNIKLRRFNNQIMRIIKQYEGRS